VALKKIGFLSFGHWSDSYGSRVRSASDSLLQSVELAVAAEELGTDGAYFRVHHFARQLSSPFPLLAAIGARTPTIEIGTAVIDMRYENPLYMAEDAGAADIIAGGRLQLGISRGSPEQVIDGWRHFGYTPAAGESDTDMARRHAEMLLDVLKGEGFAKPNPRPMFPNPPGLLRVEPHSEGLRDRIWWGSSSNATSRWAAKLGMNLQSSTLKDDESGEPLNIQQRQQIEAYRAAWKEAEHRREPRVWVSRSIFALVDDRDRAHLDGTRASAIRSVTSTATRAPSSAVRTLRSPTCWSRNLPRTRRLPPLILTIDRGWREVGNTALAFVKHFN
jgi:alkanesulfonate monooxygenase SsuD/methylene tetrahydromethanopterin reductase-like flavin-dependent oxidoreductase (luciferase family)